MNNLEIHIHKTEHLSKEVSLGCSFKISSHIFNNTQLTSQYLKFGRNVKFYKSQKQRKW